MIQLTWGIGQLVDASTIAILFILLNMVVPNIFKSTRNWIVLGLSVVILSLLDDVYNGASDILLVPVFCGLIEFSPTLPLKNKLVILLMLGIDVVIATELAALIVLSLGIPIGGITFAFACIAFQWGIAIVSLKLCRNAYVHFMNRIGLNGVALTTFILMSLGLLLFGMFGILLTARLLNVQTKMLAVTLAIIALFCIFNFIGFALYAAAFLKKKKADDEIRQLRENQIYVEELEKKYEQLRIFKHDYKNMLVSLSLMFQKDNASELNQSINALLADEELTKNTHTTSPEQIFKIKDELVRGMIYRYYIKATKHHIMMQVKVERPLEQSNLSVPITRCLGILLNNAVEASLLLEEAQINVSILKDDTSTDFIIENDVLPDQVPDMNHIYDSGYTTKGEGHGLGLASIKKISQKYNNIYIETKCQNNKFTTFLSVTEED
ncbi:sensor histidine kinase [Lactiplantibacillus plantarum]|uniref:sensor histidine kinase n=1 Tax=Lactiplantibacillus plantarum TaxID=1590 RepID=UPI00227062AB|nr:GHKL domain-containing protein [Lactiplantibacillus plantarum]MDN7038278.1 GHKL domain-containing protein [Lactiplantibacillus plantarum]